MLGADEGLEDLGVPKSDMVLYLELCFDVLKLIAKVRECIIHDFPWAFLPPGLQLYVDVVVQWVWKLVSRKCHLLVPEQLPEANDSRQLVVLGIFPS